MSKNLSITILTLALFTTTFAVNLQTPLYSVYAAQSDVGATAVTVAFAAYVAGLMPTLLLLGGLSDRIGRRLPITMALLLATAATVLLVLFPNWESLFIARVLLGIGTGLVTTAGTAYMTEIMGANNIRRATLVVTSSTSLGFGGGALATSLSLGLQGPTLMPASFVALFAIAPVLALIGLKMPRLDVPQRVSLLRFPVFPEKIWVFGIAMALAWSTTGMIIAVVPLALKTQNLDGWTGFVIFLAIFVGFLCQPIARRMTNQKALSLGLLLTPLGFFVLLAGLWVQSIILILAGTAITSASSYGFTYLAALFEFSSKAPDNRARATAGLFIYAYIGFSLPVIASGALADQFGLLPAMVIFSVTQIIITLVTAWFWRKDFLKS
ncbi:TetA [Xenorhabdus mauleonii]|uniref:Predicted arabinose efflux permease, MFS family n=1 Tax=Xenorhabdus mauleonii TaxID=351675 RepID=A0A1I3P7D6_9GAMM|nr:MFS transporter [Xenorhabdus mauleonii]PHM44895.1 TetA [Xenorhabdus mauleonii]SFJ17332.1 Predicted arabinose efflux permease, MFS family [Xenorhabdus mauleonii]